MLIRPAPPGRAAREMRGGSWHGISDRFDESQREAMTRHQDYLNWAAGQASPPENAVMSTRLSLNALKAEVELATAEEEHRLEHDRVIEQMESEYQRASRPYDSVVRFRRSWADAAPCVLLRSSTASGAATTELLPQSSTVAEIAVDCRCFPLDGLHSATPVQCVDVRREQKVASQAMSAYMMVCREPLV